MHDTPAPLIQPFNLNLQINNFAVTLSLGQQQGLVDLCTRSAKMYLARVNPSIIEEFFKKTKKEFIWGLQNWDRDPDVDPEQKKYYLDFTLRFINIALTQTWNMPALVTKYQDRLSWHTGHTRMFATGFANDDNHNNFRALVTDFDRCPTDFFFDVVPIKDDQHLCQLLGVDFHSRSHETQIPTTCDIFLEWDNTPGPYIHYLDPTDRDFYDQKDQKQTQYIEPLLARLQTWQPGQIIKVFCDDFSKVYDSSGYFVLDHAGSGFEKITPGYVSKIAYDRVNLLALRDIELWVTGSRYIDVTELFFWVNSKDNIYISREQDLSFVLGNKTYSPRTILLSNYRP